MKSIAKIIILAAVVAVAAAAVIVLSGGGGEDSGTDGPDQEKYISFYLYDNFQHDTTSGVLSQNTHLADGIWVKGYGDSKEECFKDACARAGIPVTCSGGYISEWNGSKDGNICQLGWAKNKWTPDVYLNSNESFEVRYMAIGHGRWSNGTGGEPPKPQQTPDDIRWYWGESTEPGTGTSVTFHFYDDYRYDPAPTHASVYPSDTSHLVADGYNVNGYGSTVEECFKDACRRCYGDNVVIAYNSSTGTINRVGTVSGNFNVLGWNGSGWTEFDMSSSELKEGM